MNIIGRLTKDAQVRSLSNDKEVVNFSVAVNDSYRNKAGERMERVTFFDCAYWRTTKVAAFLTKGLLVELTGTVSPRAWRSRDGEVHAALNFNAAQIKLHGSGKQHETATTKALVTTQQHEAVLQQEVADDLPF